jgi:hypothetical protein
MTKATMRNEMAKLEDIRIACVGSKAISEAVTGAITTIKEQLYGKANVQYLTNLEAAR